MIPAEAVEAAARAAYELRPAVFYLDDSVVSWDVLDESGAGRLRKDRQLVEARAVLEAAAPHMRRIVTSIEGLESLPGGAVVIDGDETVLEKLYHDQRWWHATGTHDGVSIDDITLPATVLNEPTP